MGSGEKDYNLGKQFGSILPTNGAWWGKKIDLAISLAMFAGIFYVGVAVKNTFFDKPKTQQVQTESIGSVAGDVHKMDSHNTTHVVHNHFPLSDIFSNLLSFGAKNAVNKE